MLWCIFSSYFHKEVLSIELNHFGVIADLFRQIGGHSSRFVLFCSFWRKRIFFFYFIKFNPRHKHAKCLPSDITIWTLTLILFHHFSENTGCSASYWMFALKGQWYSRLWESGLISNCLYSKMIVFGSYLSFPSYVLIPLHALKNTYSKISLFSKWLQ